ncbi:MAG TPA: hypothetical protein VK195_13655, partial [Burkholderiaceae bacterium]|nr:hypothetical protein [Burkholderiaceae bacterium]
MPPPNQASLDLPTTSLVPLAAAASLPAQDISAEVLLEKYAKGDEQTLDELRARVARALAQAEVPEARAQ